MANRAAWRYAIKTCCTWLFSLHVQLTLTGNYNTFYTFIFQDPYMYDEQLYLKADSPISRFAKESVSPDLLPHALVVNSLKKKLLACVYFLIGKVPSFANNATRVTLKTRD